MIRYQIRYGDIHSVSLFGHPVVVLSSLEAEKEFRAASPENFSHRRTNVVKNICQQGMHRSISRMGEFIKNAALLGFRVWLILC